MKKIYLITVVTLVAITVADAQNISINNNGAAAHASAMLDVNSPNKGVLIPRVALTGSRDEVTIPSPAVSILIYNTATVPTGFSVFPGYYYWGGTSWIPFASLTSTTAPWYLTGNAGTNPFQAFIGTTDDVPFNIRVNNEAAGRIDRTLFNSFWGYLAGNSITPGNFNSATGAGALRFNTTGSNNTATGASALYVNNGNTNTANGSDALHSNASGFSNVAVGSSALFNSVNTSNLVAVGDSALFKNQADTMSQY